MHPSLTELHALQQIDSALAFATRQYRSLNSGKAEQAAAEEAQAAHETAVRELHKTEGDLKDSELELQSTDEKSKGFEKKLYGGKVTAPKELQSLQDEIDALGRLKNSIDARILGLMDQLEAKRAAEAAARAAVTQTAEALHTVLRRYRTQAKTIALQLQNLNTQREAAVRPIPPPLLKKYEVMRASKHGIAVAEMNDASCAVCHTNLSRIVVQNVTHTSDIITCENCGRMLVELVPAAAAAAAVA